MARYRGSKNKKSRIFKCNIFNRVRNPMLHKQFPPGQHGNKKKKKVTAYGLQLRECNILRAFFGMLPIKYLRNRFKQAERAAKTERAKKDKTSDTNVSHILLSYLATRLDYVVYKLCAPTIFAAHQLVAHGHVLVDGKKVDIRSFVVRPGMEISLKPKAAAILPIKSAMETKEIPSNFSLNDGKWTMNSNPLPSDIDFPIPINLTLVCSFIQRSC